MRNFILALTILTGFSGLVFQVVWQKYFSFLVGGEALSSALVVSIFLGGLSVGYWAFGKIASGKSARTLLFFAGGAEVGIGLLAIAFPPLFDLIWKALSALPAEEPWHSISTLSLTVAMIFPSTFLMGSTLPLLTRALALDKFDLSKIHSSVYGLNTLGSFLGALSSGFFLIRVLGLAQTLFFLSSFNLIAGLAMLWFARGMSEVTHAIEVEKAGRGRVPFYVLALSTLSGFVSVGFEIVFIRSVNLAIGTSEYSYSLVVGVFILMIALGTLSLRWVKLKDLRALQMNFVWLIAGLVLVYMSIPYWGWLSYILGESLPVNFFAYHAGIFLLFSTIISLPVFFMGRSMPLLFSSLNAELDTAAMNVGRLYNANTVGCCLGGILLGYLSFLFLDADAVFRSGILLSCLACLIVMYQRRGNTAAYAGLAVVACGVMFLPNWSRGMMTAGLFRAHRHLPVAFSDPKLFFEKVEESKKVLLYRDDPNMNVSVIEWPVGDRSLFVNGKSDGSTSKSDLVTTMMLGHLPGLLTKATGKTAVVGLGLGTTAHALSEYEGVTGVDVFEIADAVIENQDFFSSVNGGAFKSAKVNVHHADAFSGLLSAKEPYAAVTAESSNPWVAGSDRLYSKEFYSAAADNMKEGAIFAQWMHTYEMSLPTFGIVMRTFTSVFPYVRLFSNYTDVVMIGSRTPFDEQSWRLAESRWGQAKQDMDYVGLHSLTDLALHEVFYPIELAQDSEIHSLFSPKLSFAAARDFYFAKNFDLALLQTNDPDFASNYRKAWSTSLLNRAATNDPAYALALLSPCSKDQKVSLDFSAQTQTCKSRVLELAVNGKFSVSMADAHLQKSVEFLKKLNLGGVAETDLSPSDQASLMDVFPASLHPPSLNFMQTLRERCSSESVCLEAVERGFRRFGYSSTRNPAQL